jgi:hypothetical protein
MTKDAPPVLTPLFCVPFNALKLLDGWKQRNPINAVFTAYSVCVILILHVYKSEKKSPKITRTCVRIYVLNSHTSMRSFSIVTTANKTLKTRRFGRSFFFPQVPLLKILPSTCWTSCINHIKPTIRDTKPVKNYNISP